MVARLAGLSLTRHADGAPRYVGFVDGIDFLFGGILWACRRWGLWKGQTVGKGVPGYRYRYRYRFMFCLRISTLATVCFGMV